MIIEILIFAQVKGVSIENFIFQEFQVLLSEII